MLLISSFIFDSDFELVAKKIEDIEEYTHSTVCDTKSLQADWLQYWEEQGQKLVLESWVYKYKDFIDPPSQETEPENIIEIVGAPSNEESSQSTSSQWSQLWEEHQVEQYMYYFEWFSNWWAQEKLNSTLESEIVCDVNNIALESNTEMDNTSNIDAAKQNYCKKTSLEKTKEFLSELEFSSNLDKKSNIVDCKLLTVKKKKRRKKKKIKVCKCI